MTGFKTSLSVHPPFKGGNTHYREGICQLGWELLLDGEGGTKERGLGVYCFC